MERARQQQNRLKQNILLEILVFIVLSGLELFSVPNKITITASELNAAKDSTKRVRMKRLISDRSLVLPTKVPLDVPKVHQRVLPFTTM